MTFYYRRRVAEESGQEQHARLFVITAHTIKSHRLVASLKSSGARVCEPFVEERVVTGALNITLQAVTRHNAMARRASRLLKSRAPASSWL